MPRIQVTPEERELLKAIRHASKPSSYSEAADRAADATAAVFDHIAGAVCMTGWQGSWAALAAYGKIMHIVGPFTVFRLHDALYPQYDLRARFEKWLDSDEAKGWLRTEAIKLLTDNDRGYVNPNVWRHWQALARWGAETAAPTNPATT